MMKFIRNGVKWYAETSHGEFAFGDKQGLYQWHRGSIDHPSIRIDYSGADRQCSSNGEMWQVGSQHSAQPMYFGYIYAMSEARRN